MSKKCSTFALGIGKGNTCSGKAERATQGCDLQGIAGAKTHTASARRKRGEPLPIPAPLFFVSKCMKPTYIQLWELIIDTLRHLSKIVTSVKRT